MFLLLVAWRVGTLRTLYGPQPVPHALAYLLWSLIQEFILNSFFYLSLEELLANRRRALIATVLLFTAAHFPNPVLMAATFLLSLVFVSIFRRYRNVYPLGIGHGILGLSVALALPDALLRHMRVGLSYYHFVIK